jgi:hypothetical protein
MITVDFYSALVSLLCLLYAGDLNHKTSKGLTEEQIKNRMNDVTFYTLFGLFTLILSF